MPDGGTDTTLGLRLGLIRNGYTPVPITGPDAAVDSPGKQPNVKGWQKLDAATLTPDIVSAWRDPGTGILCATVRAVDIDVLDADLAGRLSRLAQDMLGTTPLVRIGRAPKTLLVYRAEVPGRKLRTPELFLPDGSKALVEALGEGQQFVAFGIHPDTRQPYHWPSRTPLVVPLADLPAVTQDRLTAFRDAAEAIIRRSGGHEAPEKPKTGPTPSGRDYPPTTREEVEDALRAIPNDFDWGGWVAMGGSIFDALADDGEGLFLDWSSRSHKHDDATARGKWASFRTSPPTTTKAFLFHHARRHGWKPQRERDRQREKVPPVDAGEYVELTEDGVALAFRDRFRNELRYCHTSGLWHLWTGAYWKPNRDKLAFSSARELIRRLNRDRESKVQAITGKVAFAAGVEKFAQADRAFAVTAEVWDRDPFLLGTPKGTVDLRTGLLRASDPRDMITRTTAATPSDRGDDCPTWLAFLRAATGGDEGLIRFLQQWTGYCLTGDTREHALLFIYGPGGNGKSVFLNTVSRILGEYARAAPMDTFTASLGDRHPTDLAMLRGARMVTATETEEGRAWAESRIKQMTGGDPITARFMRQDFFTFAPAFKLTFCGNHKPALKSVDDANRRRFNIVPFIHKPATPDRDLEAKLWKEAPGILRWMIAGCLDWQEHGLVRPKVVTDATAEYFDAQDLIGRWIGERCKLDPNLVEKPGRLLANCQQWAKANGEAPPTGPEFRGAMEKVQGVRYLTVKGDRRVQGIGLNPPKDGGEGARVQEGACT